MQEYPTRFKEKNALLCHDWLTGMRGGEKVLEILGDWFPQAPICSLISNSSAISDSIKKHTINTSCLQGMPGIFNSYRYYLPVFPAALKTINVPSADIMISTSHCVAKGLRKPAASKHLCYCFTPMRYAWLFHEEYFGRSPVKRILAVPVLAAMRRWDRKASSNVDLFVGISEHVKKRINDFYERDAEVVYPPVDTERYTPVSDSAGNFDLIVSALVPYKKVDLAVEAYTKTGKPLKIAGIGTELTRLQAAAGPNIEFLGWQSDDQILDLYRNCRLLVFPGEEDFGIVPVEAQACGKPVVAFNRGGATETIVAGETGTFFDEQTPDSLTEAVKVCGDTSWDPQAIRTNAERFSTPRFIEGLAAALDKMLV